MKQTSVEHNGRSQLIPGVGPTFRGAARPGVHDGSVMQVSLAVVATLAGLTRWLVGGEASWLVGALLIASVIPFTLFAILPTNNKLLEPGRDNTSDETRQRLEAWGRLHAVRSVLSIAATLVYLYSLV